MIRGAAELRNYDRLEQMNIWVVVVVVVVLGGVKALGVRVRTLFIVLERFYAQTPVSFLAELLLLLLSSSRCSLNGLMDFEQ